MTTTPPAPTLTVQDDDNPCPRIEVLITPMPGDAAAVTVWRNYNGQRFVVRDALDVPVSGDHLVIDYETPLQTDVYYTCQTFDSSGVPSQLSAASATENVDEPRAWLQDPLDPTSAVPVALNRTDGPDTVFRKASFAQVTYSADVTVTPVFNSNLPIAGSSARRDVAQAPLEIRTDTSDASDALRDLLTQTPFPCLRSGGRVPSMPPVAYLAIPDVTEAYMPGPDITIWTMTAQSVLGPGSPVIVNVQQIAGLSDVSATIAGLSGIYTHIYDMSRP